jgi:hypothetical protein
MLKFGEKRSVFGDVTTLNWIGARSPRDIEINVGYGAGRLSAGYWVLLLVQSLTPENFEFSGTTLRSGGRFGLPEKTQAADDARARIHNQILDERKSEGYRKLQENALRSVTIIGPQRIAKVLPESGPLELTPDQNYPMGGGGLQWTIRKSCPANFLVALHVDRALLATTPTFAVSLADGPNLYDRRARVAKYLATATFP